MALVPCKECGREISDKAVSCPGCGVSLRKKVAPAQARGAAPLESKRTNPFAFALMASGLIVMLIFRASGTTFLGLLLILVGVIWDIYHRFFKKH